MRAPSSGKKSPKPLTTFQPDVEVVDIVLPKRGAYKRLEDGKLFEELPETGLCSCGKRPYDWDTKNPNSNVGFYCPHETHGGNGRFWLWPGSLDGKPVRTGVKKRAKKSA